MTCGIERDSLERGPKAKSYNIDIMSYFASDNEKDGVNVDVFCHNHSQKGTMILFDWFLTFTAGCMMSLLTCD